MKFTELIKTKTFWKHIILMIIVSLVIVFIIIQSLNMITRHGKEFAVPDFVGQKLENVQNSDKYDNLEFMVVDSVFNAKLPAGQILTQDPLPMSKVKSGRTIYLTVVSNTPEFMLMPNLVDLSLRQATALLETYGLQAGKLEYREDMAHNAILAMKYKGKPIKENDKIQKGSVIDLVVGRVSAEGRAVVPFLLGKTIEEAHSKLLEASLNIGEEHYESNADKSLMRVYKQSPGYSGKPNASFGGSVDLWYKSIKEVDFEKLIKNYVPDTTSVESRF